MRIALFSSYNRNGLHLIRRGIVALCAATVLAFLLLPHIAGAKDAGDTVTIYVSPAGDDSNPATQDHPIKTLQHARDVVRALILKQVGDITINLVGGIYRLDKPLELDASDSGAKGYNIIYTGPADQPAILSGGVQITGWTISDPKKNIWSASAPIALTNTRQLYVNGIRADRARGRLPAMLTETKTGYSDPTQSMAYWRNQSDIEFVYTGGNAIWSEKSEGLGAWTEPRCPVAGIEGSEITMAEPCWANSTRRIDLPKGSPYKRSANLVGPGRFGKEPAYVENAYELLGTPGQWYFDHGARLIYYVPRAGEDLEHADVEAPLLETLISGRGTESSPIHNLRFQHIQFCYATWLFPSTGQGFSEIQANYMVTGPDGYATQGLGDIVPNGKHPFGDWTKTPGNVAFTFDNHIQFIRDAFAHLGAAGLELANGSQSDTVEGCVFTDISANGLELGGVNLPEATPPQLTRDNQIDNNHFYNVPAEYHGGVAIDVGYTQRSTIQHNQLDHLPYSGISLGWGGWPDKIHQPGVANNSQNTIVANNLIHDHMLLLADGGGIYTQGLTGPTLADGEKVFGNVIYDQFSSGHAIYSDNGSCNMTINGNVMFHTNHDNWGSPHADYYDDNNGKVRDPITVENNYWQQGTPDSDKSNIKMSDNHLINSLDQVPAGIMQKAGLEPQFEDILNEKFCVDCPPAPPSRVAATAVDGAALVTWSPPIFEGTSPVQSYIVTANTGQQATVSAEDFKNQSYVKVADLTNNNPCTFTVAAANASGVGAPSMPSASVTPNDTHEIHQPGVPTIAGVYPGDGAVSVHFACPDDDGGSPILSLHFTVNPGGRKLAESDRKVIVLSGKHVTFFVIDGLSNGQAYTINVSASNAAGEGPAATSEPVTPIADSAGK